MRPFGVWFGRLAMAGACLAGAGCGGGDVPDPESDSKAASAEPSRSTGPRGRADQPEPTALASNDATGRPEKAAEPEKPAPAPKGDASGTDELSNMGGAQGAAPPAAGEAPKGGQATPPAPAPGRGEERDRPSPPPSTPAPQVPQAPPGGSAPNPKDVTPQIPPGGTLPGDESKPDAGNPGNRRMRPGQPGNPGIPNAPGGGAPGRPGALADEGMPGGGFGAVQPPAGMPGGRGMGGAGMAGADPSGAMGKDAYRLPNTAVAAFLAALKAKDKAKLAQFTAKRAGTEADEKHRKIFAAIVEESISDDELDEMAKALDGFQVVTMLQPKSSRRVGVVVSRMFGPNHLQRTIVARQEADGWKVLDIERLYEFKSMMSRGRTKSSKRNP